MTENNSYSLHKRRYAQISVKKRMELVRLVVQQGRSLSEAGRKLHINPSTVRLIIKKYNQTGTFFMKRLRNTPKSSDPLMPSTPEDSEHPAPEVKVEEDPGAKSVKVQQQVDPLVKKQVARHASARQQDKWIFPFLEFPFVF